MTPATKPQIAPRIVVLDTNVVLDWLLFGDPSGGTIGTALAAGELRWIATSAMRDEFGHVLGRAALAPWNPDPASLHARWAAHCDEVAAPLAALDRPRCTDPDDQKFIDLAMSRPDCLLLSRDRAVLKLARKLGAYGITATTPTAWAAARMPTHAAAAAPR